MSYLSIPNAGDLISVSQSQIKTNFDLADQFFGVDHVEFSESTDQGKHVKATLVKQASDPSTGASEGALYTKDVSSVMQLVFRLASDGTINQVLNGNYTSSGSDHALDLTSFGLKVKWGSVSIAANASASVTFQGSAFTGTYYSFASFEGNPGQPASVVYTSNRLSTGMTITNGIQSGSSTLTYTYLCIGV